MEPQNILWLPRSFHRAVSILSWAGHIILVLTLRVAAILVRMRVECDGGAGAGTLYNT